MVRLMVLLATLMLCTTAAVAAQRPPNIVIVLMDDLGYGDLGSYGAPDARTPNIDRLAREGVRLTDAYASGAVCTPTRAALISGRYQQRLGLERQLTIQAADRETGLLPIGSSLPELLRARGYRTALFGKWHLGFKPELGPNAHGFEEFYGFLAGAHSYYTNRADVFRVGVGPADLYENTTPVEATGYLTDELTRRAVRFVTESGDRPFFVEVAYNAVHWPFEPPDEPIPDTARGATRRLRQMPDDSLPSTRQDYVRMLERADAGVGAIMAALERQGVSRHTLVIFTSDNGGEWLSRNAPLFHRKATLWEGGIRVPLILRWPDGLPRRKVSRQTAITMDITATVLAAAGVQPPSEYVADGMDLLPILRGASASSDRPLFWRWSAADRQQRAVRQGRWKLLVDGGLLLLFDLDTDPGERTDVAGRHPERVAAMRRLLAAWEAEVDRGRAGR